MENLASQEKSRDFLSKAKLRYSSNSNCHKNSKWNKRKNKSYWKRRVPAQAATIYNIVTLQGFYLQRQNASLWKIAIITEVANLRKLQSDEGERGPKQTANTTTTKKTKQNKTKQGSSMQRQNATIGDKIVDTLTMSAPSEAFVLCFILFTQSNDSSSSFIFL